MSDASKKARRDQAREHARELREAERKRKSRNAWILRAVVGVVLIGAAVAIVLVAQGIRQAEIDAAVPKPGPANMISDGILFTGDGAGGIVAVPTAAIPPAGTPTPTDVTAYPDTVSIVTYVDLFCPVCKGFEQANAEQIKGWVAAGAATLEVHPIAILDHASMGKRYSTRSASAMGCVAEYQPNSFLDAMAALYANQPPEGTTGLTNDEIVRVFADAGIDNAELAQCVRDESFAQWVTAAKTRSLQGPVPNSELSYVAGTPTVLVNGYFYPGALNDPAEFQQFVSAVVQGAYPGTPSDDEGAE